MTELRPITENNFIDAFNLKLANGQESFVSHPIRSLAQAYVYRDQCKPFGIYAEGKMVGYVMVIYDYDVPEYDRCSFGWQGGRRRESGRALCKRKQSFQTYDAAAECQRRMEHKAERI